MRSARKNSDNFEENLLKLVRTLPTVLKFLPSQKAQDARNFVQVSLSSSQLWCQFRVFTTSRLWSDFAHWVVCDDRTSYGQSSMHIGSSAPHLNVPVTAACHRVPSIADLVQPDQLPLRVCCDACSLGCFSSGNEGSGLPILPQLCWSPAEYPRHATLHKYAPVHAQV